MNTRTGNAHHFKKGEKDSMKRIAIALLTVLLLAACVPTPEVDAVKQKNTVQMVDTVIAANENADPDATAAPVRNELPERLDWDFTTEARHVHVVADAPIRVLSDAGFPLLRCERRQFTSSENIAIAKAFLHVDPVYRGVGRRTKEDVAKQIQNLMEVLSDAEHKGDVWKEYSAEELDELLPRWQQALEDAQALYRTMDDDDVAPNPVWDGTIDEQVSVMPGETDSNIESCDCVVISTGRELPLYWSMRYMKQGEFRSAWGYKELECIDPSQYGVAHEGTGVTPYQAIEQVQALLDPFVKTTVDSIYWDDNRSDTSGSDPDHQAEYAYIVRLSPIYSGSAAGVYLYSGTEGETEGAYTRIWSRERIEAAVNDKGILMLSWTEPLKVTEVVTENCPLLPFSEIETIAKQQINYYLANKWQENGSVEITSVTLGLVRIAEPYEMNRALLVPVWCFFGEGEYPGIPDRISYDSGNPLLMINAIDGTVIDPQKGY